MGRTISLGFGAGQPGRPFCSRQDQFGSRHRHVLLVSGALSILDGRGLRKSLLLFLAATTCDAALPGMVLRPYLLSFVLHTEFLRLP